MDTLRDVDAQVADTLEHFVRWARVHFGDVQSAFEVLDFDQKEQLTYYEFRSALELYCYTGSAKEVFKTLDVEDKRILSMRSVAFLDDWDLDESSDVRRTKAKRLRVTLERTEKTQTQKQYPYPKNWCTRSADELDIAVRLNALLPTDCPPNNQELTLPLIRTSAFEKPKLPRQRSLRSIYESVKLPLLRSPSLPPVLDCNLSKRLHVEEPKSARHVKVASARRYLQAEQAKSPRILAKHPPAGKTLLSVASPKELPSLEVLNSDDDDHPNLHYHAHIHHHYWKSSE